VACGRFEGFWEFELDSWDTVAAMLIIGEAGGKVTYINGAEYRRGGANILATNGLVYEDMPVLAEEIVRNVATKRSS
jgi:myo-inositol-1(or 4)-monophosphatase